MISVPRLADWLCRSMKKRSFRWYAQKCIASMIISQHLVVYSIYSLERLFWASLNSFTTQQFGFILRTKKTEKRRMENNAYFYRKLGLVWIAVVPPISSRPIEVDIFVVRKKWFHSLFGCSCIRFWISDSVFWQLIHISITSKVFTSELPVWRTLFAWINKDTHFILLYWVLFKILKNNAFVWDKTKAFLIPNC